MRVQITGSREFTDKDLIHGAIVERMIQPFRKGEPVTVVHGGARGADTLAGEAVRDYSWVNVEVYPADWEKYGKRAGYLRNAQMADLEPDVCLAFFKTGAGNKGTQMMADLCRKRGILVIEHWED